MRPTNPEMTPLFAVDPITMGASPRGELHATSRWVMDHRVMAHRWYDGIPTMVVGGRMHRWVKLAPYEHTPPTWWPETGSEVRQDRHRSGWTAITGHNYRTKDTFAPWTEAWENERKYGGEHAVDRPPVPDGLYILCGPNMGTEGFLEHRLMRTDEVLDPPPKIDRAGLAALLLEKGWTGIWWLHPAGARCIVTRTDLGLNPVGSVLPKPLDFERISTASRPYRGRKPRIQAKANTQVLETPDALRTEAEAEVQREAGLHEVRGADAGDDGVPGPEGQGA